ncbi:MAG TPA: hypothetical protein PLY38_05795 [Candidatus Hydrothermia bacterium]|nr:hypothetical protein [Candidatus Hydrothermia bacterium]
MPSRLILLFLLLYLAFNLPFPGFKSIEVKAIKSQKPELVYEPITYKSYAEVSTKSKFDSIIVVSDGNIQTSYLNSLRIPLHNGLNEIEFRIFTKDKSDTINAEIYKARKTINIAVCLDHISPLPKVLNEFSRKHPEVSFSFFLKSAEKWYKIEDNRIVESITPEIRSFNGILIYGSTLQRDFPTRNTPALFIIDDAPEVHSLNFTYLSGEGLRIPLEKIVVATPPTPITDTIFWLEPQKLVVLGRNARGDYYLTLQDVLEFSMLYSDVLQDIINRSIYAISIPEFQFKTINDEEYLVAEPPLFSENYRLEIDINGKRMPTSRMLKGYMRLEATDSLNNATVKVLSGEKQIYDIKYTFLKHQVEKLDEKGGHLKKKIVFSFLPAQSNFIFLISMFAANALTFIFAMTGRNKNENGGHN